MKPLQLELVKDYRWKRMVILVIFLLFCRFLYPIYPLICVAASAVIDSFPDLFRDKYNPHDNSVLVVVKLLYS